MRIIKEKDIRRSEELMKKYQELMSSGRQERDKKIYEIEEQLLKLKPKLEECQFTGRTSDLQKITLEISILRAKKNVLSTNWSQESSKILGELETIHRPYISDFLKELDLALKMVESGFNFSYSQKNYDGRKDTYVYHFLTNADQIDNIKNSIIRLQNKIRSAVGEMTLEEIKTNFDRVFSQIPDGFELKDAGTGSGEMLRDLRDRREAITTGLKFDRNDLYFSVNLTEPVPHGVIRKGE